jgi:DHA1 family inner membrane transport protein
MAKRSRALQRIKSFLHEGAEFGLIGLVAIIALTAVGGIVPSIKPIVLSSYIGFFGFPPDLASYVLTCEVVGISAAALLYTFLPARWNMRSLALVCVLVVVAANCLSMLERDPYSLMVIRGVAGASAGILSAAGAAAITRVSHPARLAAALTIVNTGIGASLFFIMPILQAEFGAEAVFGGVAVLALVGASAFWRLPQLHLGAPTRQGEGAMAGNKTPLTSNSMIILAVVTIYYFGVGSFWPFAAEIGISSGIPYAEVSTILGYATLSAVLGAIICMVTAERLSQVRIFSFTLVMPPVFLAVMTLLPESSEAFTAAMIAYKFCWFLFFPSLMGIASRVDPSGRVNSLIYVFAGIGFAFGPALGGYLASLGGPHGGTNLILVKLLGIITFAPSFAILLVARRKEYAPHAGDAAVRGQDAETAPRSLGA